MKLALARLDRPRLFVFAVFAASRAVSRVAPYVAASLRPVVELGWDACATMDPSAVDALTQADARLDEVLEIDENTAGSVTAAASSVGCMAQVPAGPKDPANRAFMAAQFVLDVLEAVDAETELDTSLEAAQDAERALFLEVAALLESSTDIARTAAALRAR